MKSASPAGRLTQQAMIAALYAALTLLLQPISYGPIQCRISEALTVLPFLMPESVWGLTLGCFLANLLGGAGPLDLIFGTLATLMAGILTGKVKKRWLAPLPPLLCNMLVIGAVLAWVNTPDTFAQSFPLFAAQIGVGECVSCYGLGMVILALEKRYSGKNPMKKPAKMPNSTTKDPPVSE